jgi:hypothetical protein
MDERTLNGLGERAVAGSAALEAKLSDTVIGFGLADDPVALMIARTLADQLVRWFRRFVVLGQPARRELEIAAERVGSTITIEEGEPTVSIAIGVAPADGARIYVGADGWRMHLSRADLQPLGALGLGAPAAGFVAMLELFKGLFAEWIEGVEPGSDVHLSLFDWSTEGTDPGPEIDTVDLGDVIWIGTGAVAHGGLAALHDLPRVTGRLDLIDPDPYGESAIVRYPRASRLWNRASKPAKLAEWLRQAQPDLEVEPHTMDANTWFASSRPDCVVRVVVTTPDSADARRHVALKLPRIAINGFAEGFDIGVGTYTLGQGPCLGCRYPLDEAAISELVVLNAETGLDPRRIRELLDTVAPLTEEDLTVIQARLGLDETARANLVGKPLRSAREHLCAVGRITTPITNTEVDVPLGFVSGFCGVAVAAELIRLSLGQMRAPGWKANLKVPIPAAADWPQAPTPDCFICGDSDFVEAYREKYGQTGS